MVAPLHSDLTHRAGPHQKTHGGANLRCGRRTTAGDGGHAASDCSLQDFTHATSPRERAGLCSTGGRANCSTALVAAQT